MRRLCREHDAVCARGNDYPADLLGDHYTAVVGSSSTWSGPRQPPRPFLHLGQACVIALAGVRLVLLRHQLGARPNDDDDPRVSYLRPNDQNWVPGTIAGRVPNDYWVPGPMILAIFASAGLRSMFGRLLTSLRRGLS